MTLEPLVHLFWNISEGNKVFWEHKVKNQITKLRQLLVIQSLLNPIETVLCQYKSLIYRLPLSHRGPLLLKTHALGDFFQYYNEQTLLNTHTVLYFNSIPHKSLAATNTPYRTKCGLTQMLFFLQLIQFNKENHMNKTTFWWSNLEHSWWLCWSLTCC